MNCQQIAVLGIVSSLIGRWRCDARAGAAVVRHPDSAGPRLRRIRQSWRRADIDLGDRIVAVGALLALLEVTVDARDRAVAPGFMDAFPRAEVSRYSDRAAQVPTCSLNPMVAVRRT